MPAPLQRRDPRARNTSLIRVLRLMQLLREPSTIRELAIAQGVTPRTIWRDITVLKSVGLRIKGRQPEQFKAAKYWIDRRRLNEASRRQREVEDGHGAAAV